DLPVEVVKLAPLLIDGRPARAHTQGLEIASGAFYVTARRDDPPPKRAFLLRTDPGRLDWDSWDVTPLDSQGALTAFDHPGGMQKDGDRLWIPVAESRRNGRSVIRAFSISRLTVGQRPTPEFEFAVNDHIGALAVLPTKRLLGASWDTETVYLWDAGGHLE